MSIESEHELEQLRIAGRIVRLALNAMSAAVEAGITTAQLDAVCARVLAEHGAAPAPKKVYGFPGAACISVNDEVVHGVPGKRILQAGDLVKLDVTAEKEGFLRRCRRDGASGRGFRDSRGADALRRERISSGNASGSCRIPDLRNWAGG